jgi:hypothetical protein
MVGWGIGSLGCLWAPLRPNPLWLLGQPPSPRGLPTHLARVLLAGAVLAPSSEEASDCRPISQDLLAHRGGPSLCTRCSPLTGAPLSHCPCRALDPSLHPCAGCSEILPLPALLTSPRTALLIFYPTTILLLQHLCRRPPLPRQTATPRPISLCSAPPFLSSLLPLPQPRSPHCDM